MSADSNLAPIIIKKVKKGGGDGHHGGAWKVAYADFVTAMMAFFLLMWLLNATTEKQRKGIADYFSPTIAIARVSGGGNGALNGDSVMAEATLSKNGRGATTLNPTEAQKARGLDGQSGRSEAEDEAFKELEEQLMGHGGESLVAENALKHIITRVTDEGLVIELFSLNGRPLFQEGTDAPTQLLVDLARLVHGVSKAVTNEVAVEGHVASEPIVKAHSEVWKKSAARADIMRELLVDSGMRPDRLRRVTGHADREPSVPDLMATRNDRLEIILLRDVGG
ncbi:chemotaxis protein MotB [Aliishimia ponticola]|uniref:Chemotaxis protein MotB n=1 Tax=Aliishimia ponticola TaxID=2499833 RepID=A0A4S4N9P8_9RHOB|nr:flagellar motor protein MotB [Aliishimia ponticola]THH34808.1 chemotaxis protein MotB [Aliishimia ponticola]